MTSVGGAPQGTTNPDDGDLDLTAGRAVVRFRRRFPQGPDQVWRALTEPDHLAAWFPTTIEGGRAVGATLRFSFPHHEGPPMDGEMVAFDPPRLMELQWGEETLRFELHGEADGTVLDFTATFTELGKTARDAAGWHACLDLLACAVEGRRPPWTSAERWRLVRDGYVARFGPEASAIGPPEEWERVHGSGSSSAPSS